MDLDIKCWQTGHLKTGCKSEFLKSMKLKTLGTMKVEMNYKGEIV